MNTELRPGSAPLLPPTPPAPAPTFPDICMPPENHHGTLLVTAALAGLAFPILAPIAWRASIEDLKSMKAGAMDWSGGPTTDLARVIAKMVTLIWVIVIATAISDPVIGVIAGVVSYVLFQTVRYLVA